ncbi:hypothetical protein [Methylosinus sp. R-45379]|uniref:hypothetical protein n=1 Tax=Methylosinus sp. R-45379 TaxID=980563 RepID=UPI001FD9B9A3|nr:hypothetical protein [Methylosinus sp. R-45379]
MCGDITTHDSSGRQQEMVAIPTRKLPTPIVVETPRLPPTLAQTLGPILAAGVRDLARRYALANLARRAVALVAGPRPHVGAIEFSRRGDGVYELRRPLLHHRPDPPNL